MSWRMGLVGDELGDVLGLTGLPMAQEVRGHCAGGAWRGRLRCGGPRWARRAARSGHRSGWGPQRAGEGSEGFGRAKP